MLGSISIGLSGMRAFADGLRQISNNITNLNSNGFKTSTLGFVDLFSTTDKRDAQSGQGVALAPPQYDFAQGELRQSDRDLDLAIDGEGFLVLLKDADRYFARTGSFEVTENGDIVLAGTDYKLTVLDGGAPRAVSVAPYRTSPPQKTATVTFSDNLSSTATSAVTVPNIAIFDADGQTEAWSAKFERPPEASAGEWTVTVTNGKGETLAAQALKFINGVVDPTTSRLTFEDTAGGRSATFDFSQGVTSFSSGELSTLRAAKVDGHGIGEISTITVDEKGVLRIGYSNEQKKELGAITLAHIRDPQALNQRDGGLFVLDDGAGADYQTSAHETVGLVMGKRLEASNVNLSAEFGDLILVQRGFQASSQVVSVSNDMIQQLFGIRGQG